LRGDSQPTTLNFTGFGAILGNGTSPAEPRVMKNARALLAAGLGGALATALDVGLLVLLVGHHVAVPLATFIAALAGAAMTFVINKYVAFRDRSPINLLQLLRFDFVVVVAALLMAAAMQLVSVRLGVPVVLAKLGCAALVFALWTYPAQRRLVFVRGA
jgi:putative flippase GtrA